MSENVDSGARGVLSSALLVAAVSGILVTGFILKSQPKDATAHLAARQAPPDPPALGATIVQEPAPAVAALEPPQEPDPVIVPATPAAAEPTAGVPSPRPLPSSPAAATADPLVVKLATRAERDHARLSRAAGRWTAQLMVACKPETVDRLLASAGSSEKLFVLPARVNDDACFRVCFGTYQNPKDAAAAFDMPKTLRGKDKVGAVEIAKVLL